MNFDSDLQVGTKIGEGQFGEVFEGIDQIQGKVAIKRSKQQIGESQEQWAARSSEIIREGVHLKTASHGNVVRVINVLSEKQTGVAHLVVEFCNGGSIQDIYEKGPMTLKGVRKVATNVALGLANIHASGLIHRDIKPGNILIHDRVAKVADFGLVTDNIILGYAAATGYTAHLAPEVYQYGVTSAKTDIWALGMTIYRLLHGHEFYEENFPDSGVVRDRVERGGFAKKLPWLPHVPDEWRRFVRRSMHDDSSSRFQTAVEFGHALASLPVDPDWRCTYSSSRSTWARTKKLRTISVEWIDQGQSQGKWEARASGNSKRAMKLGGSQNVARSVAQKELEAFFKGQS